MVATPRKLKDAAKVSQYYRYKLGFRLGLNIDFTNILWPLEQDHLLSEEIAVFAFYKNFKVEKLIDLITESINSKKNTKVFDGLIQYLSTKSVEDQKLYLLENNDSENKFSIKKEFIKDFLLEANLIKENK